MMTVGIAVRLGLRPAEVAEWPMEELSLVMGYLELESEEYRPRSQAPAPHAGGGEPQRRTIYVVKRKGQ